MAVAISKHDYLTTGRPADVQISVRRRSVEVTENLARQPAADSMYLLQIFDARAAHALQASEMPQQRSPALRAESRDIFED